MHIFAERYRLVIWLVLVLAVGFVTTSVAGYIVSRDAIRQSITDQALPLTGDNIYSEIQKDMLRPQFIASLMAHDTFVRDWILAGEKDPAQIVRYLAEVKQKYGTVTSFLVTENSRNYYHAGGILKKVDEKEPRDLWYFRVRKMQADFETNVDIDMVNQDAMTIFINHRVFDFKNNYIGAIGVGLTLDAMTSKLDSYQQRFHRNIFFTRADGTVVLTGTAQRNMPARLQDIPGIGKIAGAILNGSIKPTSLEYAAGKSTVLVNSRFLPELGWYLVVEQNVAEDVIPVQRVFMLNLAISALVTLLVMALALVAVNRYQKKLEHVASTDALTGMLNRKAFDFLFRQALRESSRSGAPLSTILFDIDRFKNINDQFGHLAGDAVIRAIANVTRSTIRESDVLVRWGGEEFLIMLKDCPLEQALGVAEKLRNAIEGLGFPEAPGVNVTISLGVAQRMVDEAEDAFFTRADRALYRAKEQGRNRSEAA